MRDSQNKGFRINKTLPSKESLFFKKSNEKSAPYKNKTLNEKGISCKKLKIQIPGSLSHIGGTMKTTQTLRNNILEGEEQTPLNHTKENHTQGPSNKNLSKNSPTLKNNDEAGKSLEKGWGKNIFWLDFEKMKEFEFYFKKDNVNEVVSKINKMDLEMSEKINQVKKTRKGRKSNSGTSRKGISTKNFQMN